MKILAALSLPSLMEQPLLFDLGTGMHYCNYAKMLTLLARVFSPKLL